MSFPKTGTSPAQSYGESIMQPYESDQVSSLLAIIETLQEQGVVLSSTQLSTIEVLKGRVQLLTDSNEALLAEKDQAVEQAKQLEAREAARILKERERSELARKANEAQRQALEAAKASRITDLQKQHLEAWRCEAAAKDALNTLRRLRCDGLKSCTWTDSRKIDSISRFHNRTLWMNSSDLYCYEIKVDDWDAERYLLQQIDKYEPLEKLLREQKDALSR